MSYEELSYKENKSYYDIVNQCFNEIKYGISSGNYNWSKFIDISGITAKFSGEDFLELTFHHYETCTFAELEIATAREDGKKFLKDFLVEIKKRFNK